jgi:uncharacterized protein
MNNMINRNYSIDLNLTDDCNWRCKYCIEKDYHCTNYMSEKVVDAIIQKADYLLDRNYFNTIKFGFWGGEPTLNIKAMEKIINYYYKNSRVSFGIFTNGELIDKILPLIDKAVGYFKNPQRFEIQVSYDGFDIHNKKRVTRNDKQTAQNTRDLILRLYKSRRYSFHLKSTFSYDDVDHVYDSYKDVYDLSNEAGNYRGIRYSPTIDYSDDFVNILKDKDKYTIFKNKMIEQLEKICINEYQAITNSNSKDKGVFTWLKGRTNSLFCSAGYNYHMVNYDGTFYTCHGCIYTETSKDHLFNSVFDSNKDFVEHIIKHNEHFKNSRKNSEKCKKCPAVVCYKCNASYYNTSKKEDFEDRWYDYSDKNMCQLYRDISYIIIAWKDIIREKVKHNMS